MISEEMLVLDAFNRFTGEDFPTPTGSKFEPTYEVAIDSNGHRTLMQTGETNIYEKIQESLEGTKIENIIKRIMGGDFSDLSNGGVYMDTTTMPKNLMELQNLNIKMENQFMKLPVEERAKYNHNVGEYIKTLSDKMEEKINESAKISDEPKADTNASGEPSGV